jgi:hypothetical protein
MLPRELQERLGLDGALEMHVQFHFGYRTNECFQ